MKSIYDYFPAPTKEDFSRIAKKFDAMSEKEKKQLEQNWKDFFESLEEELSLLDAPLCRKCQGSGLGMVDGNQCTECKGRGLKK